MRLERSLFLAGGALLALAASATLPIARAGDGLLRDSATVYVGGYLVSESGQSALLPGALSVEYAHLFGERISAFVDYNLALTLPPNGFGLLGSGFDLGAQYCWLSCAAVSEERPGFGSIERYPVWGASSGLAVSQRSFQLATAVVGYGGASLRTDAFYSLRANLRAEAKLQFTYLTNYGQIIRYANFVAGLSFLF